jgi:replicative DNA helicase
MIRAGWRVILVAPEGVGKSTISRQIAVRVATGLHPFCATKIPPVRTLIADFENPEDVIDEQGNMARSGARRALRDGYIAGNCYLWSREAGIDLRQRVDRARFEAVIAKVQPKLVVLGPLYKTFRSTKNEGEEQPVQEVQAILDDIRTRYGFALVMEHHAPHGTERGRDLRPFGSSAWLRWPEFGLKLLAVPEKSKHPKGSLRIGRFRKDRLPATWPDVLERGREWTGIWPDGTFDEPLLNEGF